MGVPSSSVAKPTTDPDGKPAMPSAHDTVESDAKPRGCAADRHHASSFGSFPSALASLASVHIQDKQTDMAPSNISPGSAATVLSFLALAGLQLETRFRVGEVLARERPRVTPRPLGAGPCGH